jgi:hypothetical protein
LSAALTDIRQFCRFSSQDLAIERFEQRQFAVAASKGQSKPVVDSTAPLKRNALLTHDAERRGSARRWRTYLLADELRSAGGSVDPAVTSP